MSIRNPLSKERWQYLKDLAPRQGKPIRIWYSKTASTYDVGRNKIKQLAKLMGISTKKMFERVEASQQAFEKVAASQKEKVDDVDQKTALTPDA